MPKAAILEKLETINQASGALEDLELVAALANTVLGRIAEAEGGKDAEIFCLRVLWAHPPVTVVLLPGIVVPRLVISRGRLPDMTEVHRTEASEYRARVQRKEAVLKRLLDKLRSS